MNELRQNGVLVTTSSKTYELLTSTKPEDKKAAKRLSEFCDKAYAANYDIKVLKNLREQYKDVV